MFLPAKPYPSTGRESRVRFIASDPLSVCRNGYAANGGWDQNVACCRVFSDMSKYQLIWSGILPAGKIDRVLSTLATQPHKAAIAGDLYPSIDPLPFNIGFLNRQINTVSNLLRTPILQFEINALPLDLVTESTHCNLIRTDPPVQTGQIVASRLMYLLNFPADLIRLPHILVARAGKFLTHARKLIL